MRVRIMSALGISEDDMCRILGDISVPTLRKYYAEQIRIGHLEANTKVAAAVYSTALKGGREGTAAGIFWLKCRAGWREDGEQGAVPEPRAPKLGKKEERAIAAQNPDGDSTIGSLMRKRMGMH